MFGDGTGRDLEREAARGEKLAAALRTDAGVHGVALTYVDTAGVTRVKAVPVARLGRAARWGVGMSKVFDVFLSDDSITASADVGGPDGDLRLVPDLDRLVALAAQPGWAWAPVDRYEQTGEPWAADQRLFTKAITQQAAVEHGLEFRMAFETEWALGRGEGGPEEFVPATGGPAYGMTRLIEQSDYGRDLLQALEAQGIAADQFHPEYASGQYELSIAPRPPVGAADDNVLVRQTVRAVGHRAGLRTSFSPSVVAGTVGNGGHVHLSAWRDGANVFAGGEGRHGLTPEGEAFAAGILAELPALCAIGAPTPASYLRLVPSHWAGIFACWGLETRETALRLVTGNDGLQASAANLEVKCFDLSANPYLVTGALIAAGLHGLRQKLTLPDEVTGDPARFSEDELAGHGIGHLPGSLDDAADALEASAVLGDALGPVRTGAILAVRRAEAERFREAAPEEIAAALRWVF
jgi:glutamine synthetase